MIFRICVKFVKRFAFFHFASTKGFDRISPLNIIYPLSGYRVQRYIALPRDWSSKEEDRSSCFFFFFLLSFSVDEDVTLKKEEEEEEEQVLHKEATWKHSVDGERRC